MAIPTAREINPFDDLDGQNAEKHFLGKTVSEAVGLFEEGTIYYVSDLMWMGPVAFAYYLPAAVQYVESERAEGDSDIVNCLHSTIDFRLDADGPDIAAAFPMIRRLAAYVLDHYERFDVSPEIYGDLNAGYRRFIERVPAKPGDELPLPGDIEKDKR